MIGEKLDGMTRTTGLLEKSIRNSHISLDASHGLKSRSILGTSVPQEHFGP